MAGENLLNDGEKSAKNTKNHALGALAKTSASGKRFPSSTRSQCETYLVFRVRRKQLKCPDRELELVAVRELPNAHAEADQRFARDTRRALHHVLAHVVDALFFWRGVYGQSVSQEV